MKKLLILVIALQAVMSSKAYSAEEHHNLSVTLCRAYPNGNLQIRGISSTDDIERHLTYAASVFSEKTIDRYLSMCLASLMTGKLLRTDYLECTDTTCAPKPGTTAQVLK